MSIIYLGKATPASGQGGGGSGEAVWGEITGTLADQTDLADALSAKQDTLVSGTNIKTVNSESLLGSGNITISGSVPNQNTAVGATNPLEFWEGTEAEYNSGGESTTYYNWEKEDVRIVDFETTSSNYQYTSVAYGNNICVTCLNDKVKYSSDTINWSEATLPVTINKLVFGNNLFIGYQNNSTNLCISSDGASWTSVTGIADNIKQIVFGNGIFLMGCADKNFYTSSDGQTWTEISSATNGIFSIAYANGKFIYADTTSNSARSVPFYISSDNGATWTLLETVSSSNIGEFVYTAGVGNVLYWGMSGVQKMSTDGGTTITSDNYVGNKKITFGNDTYFYLTTGSNQTIYSSSDGVTWTSYFYFGTKMGSGYNPIKDLVYGNNAVISVGGRYINSQYYNSIAIYPSTLSVFTTDENPTTESTVYSAPNTPSALTITTVGTGTITCSDTNTYTYNASGNQTVTQNVGESHPNWICMIEGVGIKKGTTVIASATTVDQTYDATSANAQSGVAVASGIADSLGTINTQLESIIAQGD